MQHRIIVAFVAKCGALSFAHSLEEGQGPSASGAALRLEQCENDLIFDRILSRMMDWTQFVEIDYDEEADRQCAKEGHVPMLFTPSAVGEHARFPRSSGKNFVP